MDLKLTVNQGKGLSIVADRAMEGGICFAITTQWAFILLRGESYETEVTVGQTFRKQKGGGSFKAPITEDTSVTVQKGFFSLVALQRGYDLVDLKLADKMSAANQDSFFKVASEFSEKYLKSLCRSNECSLKPMATYKTVAELVPTLSFVSGTVDLIGIFGVDDGKNWGHIVGTGVMGKNKFFDANSGEWTSPDDGVHTDIIAYLNKYYAGIQNCARYTIAK